jgi:hypothetical protein
MKEFIVEIIYDEWIILLLVIFLSFIQRSLLRILFPGLIDFDTYYHLFYKLTKCLLKDPLVVREGKFTAENRGI